ncbi:DUF2066 domain-containing protein [Mesorhizobium neociceri]|uniref:DUF2066 domain-containing protein n=1 Tax=Mesorhizobium neociceri TaxID=1307853 RepID=A0A838B2X2_9HYPH|nr:DUF2066 domain-containing protein [Mesorhizobium neociceri]MBA1140229.1 DUF2066 domain-containing protein [Mesorhizobium neociceri]
MKFGFVAAVLAALIAFPVAAADIDRASLYRAQSVTNGTGEENRAWGLAPCLEEVLVKVSGDPRLIGDPRVAEMSRHAADYVTDVSYRDLLNNRPPHDEQGTHDRPQYLTADFDPDRIDALLASLGRKPWPVPRPAIVALLDIKPMKGDSFTLVRDGGGELVADMRGALADAAHRTGLPLELPKPQDVALADVADTLGGDASLSGTLAWRQEALGWVGDWRLGFKGREYRWQVRGVSFDDAFRNATRGTLQILSGNGQP